MYIYIYIYLSKSRFYILTCTFTIRSSSITSFDLNFSPTNNKNHSFELNTTPAKSDDYSRYGNFRDEGDSVHATKETYIESGEPVIRIISSSEIINVIIFQKMI